MLGDQVMFLEGVNRDRMSELFQTANVFALASLHEMMPIALLEALASGLPIACNDTPTMRWMAGPAGALTDIAVERALAAQIEHLSHPTVNDAFSRAARAHAESTFSETAVIQQYLDMYHQVMASS
jgi:glycosyltransferase involved in cell wall biosynthesis